MCRRCANQSWAAQADQICTVSTDGTSWAGRAASPIGCHSLPITLSLTVSHTEHTCSDAKEWIKFWSGDFFLPFFFFASILQNFHSDEITLENRLWMDAWAQNCSVAAVYLLKCERLIRPGLPWWDSLITCHWVQVVELPLQPLLVLWTSKMQHKFFIMSLFPFAIVCAEVSVHVHNRLLFCKGKTFLKN